MVRPAHLAWAAVALAAGLVACDPGAECTDSCEEDADCIAGHVCIAFVQGRECAPVECRSCFEVCRFSINPHSETVKTCIWEGCE